MRRLLLCTIAVALLLSTASAQSQIGDIIQKIENARSANSKTGLSSDTIAAGLKEALTVSTGRAVASTGRVDGFLKNQAIKILLPEKLRRLGSGLRLVGMGPQIDELEVGMNRAAEQATPLAKQIFINSIKRMSFDDARRILTGGDTAATDYFRNSSSAELKAAFAPIVHNAMIKVGVVRQYNQIVNNSNAAPLLRKNAVDLDDYVVTKTLDGLFYTLAEEETRIRKDPAAQTTALLKQVFGHR